MLSMLPQFHVAAWNCQPLLAWWVGATVVLERSFQPRRVLQLLAERGVTAMMGVPTQYRLLADDPAFPLVTDWCDRTRALIEDLAGDAGDRRHALAPWGASVASTAGDHGGPLVEPPAAARVPDAARACR